MRRGPRHPVVFDERSELAYRNPDLHEQRIVREELAGYPKIRGLGQPWRDRGAARFLEISFRRDGAIRKACPAVDPRGYSRPSVALLRKYMIYYGGSALAATWASEALKTICGRRPGGIMTNTRDLGSNNYLPDLTSSAAIPGLSEAVDLSRAAWGIPHIRAASHLDAFAGLGFAHAQHRLWQMQALMRRRTRRYAEPGGKSPLAADSPPPQVDPARTHRRHSPALRDTPHTLPLPHTLP